MAKKSEAGLVAALEAAMPALLESTGSITASFEGDIAKWRKRFPDDPIVIETDLLSPLGRERYEPSHTQAIAYLIDANSPPPSELALARLLDVLLDTATVANSPIAKRLKELSERKEFSCRVTPERFALLGGKTLKTDLWLELRSGHDQMLIVIENKIDSHPTHEQLNAYANVAKKQAGKSPVALFLLSLEDKPDVPEPWLTFRYDQLAIAWLSLFDEPPSSTREFARLYLATIFQHLLELRFRDGAVLSYRRRQQLEDYLRVRLDS